jgi:hypothetical protein
MQTFCLLLQKIIKSKEIFYFGDKKQIQIFSTTHYDNDFSDVSFTIYNIIYDLYKKNYISWFFCHDINKIVSIKFNILKDYIINNNILDDVMKNKLFDIFSKCQRFYSSFAKLLFLYRYKKYKIVVSDDLTLTPLNEKDKNTFVLIQNNSKYLFSIRDLNNIIETSLLNHFEFFAEPKHPKNPYNNIHFSYTDLCNMYLKMKSSSLFSNLFYLYFVSDFSLVDFRINNEAILRDLSIKKYVNNTPSNIIKNQIIHMLEHNTFSRNWHIDKEFPIDILANIFRPFLYNYLIINSNFRGMEKNIAYQDDLEYKLERMYRDNPNFGKKMYKTIQVFGNIQTKEVFNTNHINFYGKRIENYIFDETWQIIPNRTSLLLHPISFIFNSLNIDMSYNIITNIINNPNYNVHTDNSRRNSRFQNRRRIRPRREVMPLSPIETEFEQQIERRVVTPILSPNETPTGSPINSPSYSVSTSISVPEQEQNIDSSTENESEEENF